MKKGAYSIAISLCIVTILGCATAQKGAMSRAYSGIEKGEFEFALKRLSKAEKYVEPTPDLQAEIVYLRAACYEGLKRYSEAIEALKYLKDKFPDTNYAYQAKEKLKRLEKRNYWFNPVSSMSNVQGFYDPILRIETGRHTGKVWSLDVNKEGTRLYTVSKDKTLRIWSIPDLELVKTVRISIGSGDRGALFGVALSPDGKTLAFGGDSIGHPNAIYLYDLDLEELKKRINGFLGEEIEHISFSSDGNRLVASMWDGGGIRVVDVKNHNELFSQLLPGNCMWAEFGQNGQLAAVAKYSYLYNEHFKNIAVNREMKGPRVARFSPDGSRIFIGSRGTPKIFHSKNLSSLFSLDTSGLKGKNFAAGTWSNDGSLILAGSCSDNNGNRVIRIWKDSGRKIFRDIKVINDYIAYSAQIGHLIRRIPAGCSAPKRPPISGLNGH